MSEIVVTGAGSPQLRSLADLSGQQIHVRASSSYYEHVLAMNESLRAEGKEPIRLVAVPEVLDDDDLLQMLNAGLVPLVVVDQHIAEFWARVFEDPEPTPALPPERRISDSAALWHVPDVLWGRTPQAGDGREKGAGSFASP